MFVSTPLHELKFVILTLLPSQPFDHTPASSREVNLRVAAQGPELAFEGVAANDRPLQHQMFDYGSICL